MKNKFIKIALLVVSSVMFFSCEKEDDLLARKGKPVLTADSKSFDVYEGYPINLDFTLSHAIKSATEVRIEIVGGTAVEGEDFVVDTDNLVTVEEQGGGFFGGAGYYFSLPALETKFSVSSLFKTVSDGTVEEPETIVFRLHSVGKGEAIVSEEITVRLIDQEDFSFELKFDGTFDNNGTPAAFCDVDMDLEIYDSEGNLVKFSYSGCPEFIGEAADDVNNLGDGDYTIVASLWTNAGFTNDVFVPAKLILTRGSNAPFEVDMSDKFKLSDGGLDDGNANALIALGLKKRGGVYTLYDLNDNVAFTGKVANKINKKLKK